MTETTWRRIMFYGAVAKASVVGVSLGLAIFGAMDFTAAVTASNWLEFARKEYLFDIFAIGGGVVGALTQMVLRF